MARIRAERKCGEFLKQQVMNKGGKPVTCSPEEQVTENKTLTELGITRKQSMNWQKLAGIPEEIFEEELHKGDAMPSLKRMVNNFRKRTEEANVIDVEVEEDDAKEVAVEEDDVKSAKVVSIKTMR
ncbi:hypothetical protein MNBD_GAMMA08-816 [hydrothermal vent metagenome]|uniref:Uncharacterized protein n=1 Tax=hydrothermal vent metagenome TaxID=652676 RepID=A0A3B0X5I2_9ZZZZ